MDLCLAQNDPSHSVFITQDGIPLYVTSTHNAHGNLQHTTIRRLERESSLAGQAETEVGRLLYSSSGRPRRSLVYSETVNIELVLNAAGNTVTETDMNSWMFTGPDKRPYKWQIFIQYPVLLLDDNSQTPLARYKRAKLGILSKSRRPSLEILPAGVNCIDLIVVTFVSYMIYRFPNTDATAVPVN